MPDWLILHLSCISKYLAYACVKNNYDEVSICKEFRFPFTALKMAYRRILLLMQ